jgi:carbonic anhydrase/acetyltransferase-like protein (isoleucine patch superfamily)
MGSPGKVVRQLDKRAIKGLAMSAEGYVHNFKRFKKDLKTFP